jgi:hypothetical protein
MSLMMSRYCWAICGRSGSIWKAGSSGRMGHISLWPGFMYLSGNSIFNNDMKVSDHVIPSGLAAEHLKPLRKLNPFMYLSLREQPTV